MTLHHEWLHDTAVIEPDRPPRERHPWTVGRAVLWATLAIEVLVIAGLGCLYVLFGVYLLRGGR